MRWLPLFVISLACTSESDRWDGFFYPDAGDLVKYERGGPFRDLQSCRNWAAEKKSKAKRTNTDYECGKNCRPAGLEGMNVCEETVR